jgi:hypothetical protein
MTKHAPIKAMFDNIHKALGRLSAELAALQTVYERIGQNDQPVETIDPKDPDNFTTIGGQRKLSEQGLRVCDRLLAEGKTNYAIGKALDMSWGAIAHRRKMWERGAAR